jgi:glyoxylase-like metal-dependent hydrolase (beta-lactamase superfamily II)
MAGAAATPRDTTLAGGKAPFDKIGRVSNLEPIDLLHQGERVIAVYLLDTREGPALFDCGPTSTLENLRAGLAARGLTTQDLGHLLLSHIHLDHAGAAGTLVRENPTLQVHVSEIGAPHLIDPSRLERSARRLYGETFDHLWGELAPVPAENVHPVGTTAVGLEAFPTPGHASHHVSYLDGDGTIYAGDAAGVRIVPGRHILPVSPPPDIDLEGWHRTIDELERREPGNLALIHFGVVDDPPDHLDRLRTELDRWAARVRDGMDEHQFVAAARADLLEAEERDAPYYERAAPFWQSYAGLKRYWDRRDRPA